jgi:hypothetical protein
MLTPKPFPLKLIILGNNQVAFDASAAPSSASTARTVEHIQLAEDRGFGTTNLAKIKITGDVTLDEAKARAKGFEVGLIRVEKYFQGSHITAYAGPPPEAEHSDYCWGGCPGAIEEAIEILRLFDQNCDRDMKRLHVVFGAYRGKIDAPRPARRSSSSATAPTGRGRSPTSRSRSATSTRIAARSTRTTPSTPTSSPRWSASSGW